MNDVVLMAVVDAGEDLLHKNGSVSLRKLSSLQDLVEELSSFADSTQKCCKCPKHGIKLLTQ